MADDGLKFSIDGEEYEVDDFEGRELVEAERAFGISLIADLQRGTVTAIYALLYLVKKRSNPRVTVDEVLKLSLGEVGRIMGGEEQEPVPPPKPAAKAKSKSA